MYSRVGVAISGSIERLPEGPVIVGRCGFMCRQSQKILSNSSIGLSVGHRALTKPRATAVIRLRLWKEDSDMYLRVDVAILGSTERLLEGHVTIGCCALTKPRATAVVRLGLWKEGSNYVLTGWCCNIGLNRETSRRACDCRMSWIYVQAITKNNVQFLDWTF